jgi:hypothetical protein
MNQPACTRLTAARRTLLSAAASRGPSPARAGSGAGAAALTATVPLHCGCSRTHDLPFVSGS